MRSCSLFIFIGYIAKIHSIDIANYYVISKFFPEFQNTDEQRVFGQRWVEMYLEPKNPIYELMHTLRQHKMKNWEFREISTNPIKSKKSQLLQKIVMKYAAIFRTGVYYEDHKLEEGKYLDIFFFNFFLKYYKLSNFGKRTGTI